MCGGSGGHIDFFLSRSVYAMHAVRGCDSIVTRCEQQSPGNTFTPPPYSLLTPPPLTYCDPPTPHTYGGQHVQPFFYCYYFIIYFFTCMFYQLLRVQYSCSSTQSWGSVLPSIVEMRDQNSRGRPMNHDSLLIVTPHPTYLWRASCTTMTGCPHFFVNPFKIFLRPI